MEQFASKLELAAFMGVAADDIDTGRCQALLTMASAVIRGYCEQDFDLVEDDVYTFPGADEHRHRLFLPQRPVLEVSSVVVDGVELSYASPTFEYLWTAYGLLERIRGLRWWPRTPESIVVTYSHGYETIPLDIKAVCTQIAARGFMNPAGLKSETIDDYAVVQSLPLSGVPIGLSVSDTEASVLDNYRVPALG